jgi:DnaJ-class molecular chaperone
MSGTSNHYSVLGVPRDVNAAALKKAYHHMAMKWHPDKNPANVALAQAKFQEVITAYHTLCDPDKRAAYNRELNQKESGQREAQSRPAARSPFHVDSSSTSSEEDDSGFEDFHFGPGNNLWDFLNRLSGGF